MLCSVFFVRVCCLLPTYYRLYHIQVISGIKWQNSNVKSYRLLKKLIYLKLGKGIFLIQQYRITTVCGSYCFVYVEKRCKKISIRKKNNLDEVLLILFTIRLLLVCPLLLRFWKCIFQYRNLTSWTRLRGFNVNFNCFQISDSTRIRDKACITFYVNTVVWNRVFTNMCVSERFAHYILYVFKQRIRRNLSEY